MLLGTLTVIDAVPVVEAFGATRTRDGSLLVIVACTPPWADAPRVALVGTCSHAPTVTVAGIVMPGPVTVTARTPLVVMVVAPGAVAVTVDEGGTANLTFRPAATLAARGTARIATSLAADGRPTVALAELAVEVLP